MTCNKVVLLILDIPLVICCGNDKYRNILHDLAITQNVRNHSTLNTGCPKKDPLEKELSKLGKVLIHSSVVSYM